MKDYNELQSKLEVANRIRGGFNKWDNEYSKDSRCDKKYIGFNSDQRFEACKGLTLRVDSWHGYYGDSNCSNIFTFSNEKVFNDHLLKVLKNDFRGILMKVAKSIEAECATEKQAAINELRAALAKCESL